ncbi:MAG: TolC family protein [Spirochaetales bacterium]|nr:TolC family protein [Spirochaetales bacterium]
MNKKMMIIFFILSVSAVFGESILEKYVEEGLSRNLSLLSAEYCLKESIARVNEARGKFFPTISVEARTSWNWGGRTMSLPVGDIVNPLYSIHGIPPIPSNYDIPMLPGDDQELKIRVMQPVFVSSLYYNAAIQELMKNSAEFQRAVTARFLTAEIKKAYFTCMKAAQIRIVLENAGKVLDENLRVTEVLFKNGVVTEDAVYRARAEKAGIQQKITEAGNGDALSVAYFNFLLQRQHDTPVKFVSAGEYCRPLEVSLQEAVGCALSFREELLMLVRGKSIQDQLQGLHTGSYLPSVFIAVDGGLFADGFQFSINDYFLSFSIVARWEAFDGFQAASRAEQAGLAASRMNINFSEMKDKIRLEVQEAYSRCIVSQKTIESAREELSGIEKYFSLVEKKYQEGLSSQLEYFEAQSRLTRASINVASAEYDYCINFALLESVSCISKKDMLTIGSISQGDEQK